MEGVQIGRIVHYVLTGADCEEINRRRIQGVAGQPSPCPGAQAHVGNVAWPGTHVAMVITSVFGDGGMVNGQCLLDGNDTFWATSRAYGEALEPFTWHWPERV